ncbi:MAG: extracellular solute-binding protein [Candidatus Pacebacteria bacterium]|nr:extracellular solute-binding protein [Candidatus Paceibacterota bacterium]MBP9716229.1 extracellular solute-binding protein [Candidatus Paceibacterota bacterium]
MSNFQTIFTAIFLAFFVFGVLVFAGLIPLGKSSNSNAPVGNVVIWGTFPSLSMSKIIEDINSSNQDLIIKYVQKPKDTYQQDILEAMASGAGPDLFFITPDMVIKNKKFIFPMPYANYPEKSFSSTFIEGSSVFLAKDGVMAFPVVSDPLVLYYNKELLTNAGIAKPPVYWDELFELNSSLTKKNNDGVISQSMIALGGFDNINNAKDIMTLLLIGSGDSIIQNDRSDGTMSVVVNDKTPFTLSPVETAIGFFNEFSNLNNQAYSWNRSLPNSKEMFTSGKLAFYIGRASELFEIESVNPNLSFDVTNVLQTRNTNLKRTNGPIYALATNSRSTNVAGSLGVAGLISSPDIAREISTALSIPPAQKDLLNENPTDPYIYTFYKSAIYLYPWLDPDTKITDIIFRDLYQNLISNKLSSADAVNKLQSQLDLLIKK